MKNAPQPPGLVGPGPFRVAEVHQSPIENPASGSTADHPAPSAPRSYGATPVHHETRPAPQVIGPVVNDEEDASISDLARAYVHDWEESLARDTPPPPPPWGDSDRDLSPRGNGVHASGNERNAGAPPAFVPARRIMIVDDEDMITRTLGLALEQIGYTVTTFTLPEQALIRFQATPRDFDLLITDYRMPNLTGLELAAKIRACSPAAGIMVLSGYSVRLTPSQVQQLGISALLSKPIEIATLAGVLNGYFEKREQTAAATIRPAQSALID